MALLFAAHFPCLSHSLRPRTNGFGQRNPETQMNLATTLKMPFKHELFTDACGMNCWDPPLPSALSASLGGSLINFWSQPELQIPIVRIVNVKPAKEHLDPIQVPLCHTLSMPNKHRSIRTQSSSTVPHKGPRRQPDTSEHFLFMPCL